MFIRLPALAAGAALAALVGGGITYATADDSADRTQERAAVRKVTKSMSFYGVKVEEDFDANYSIIGGYARCPLGTQLTGGGFSDLTDGITYHANRAPSGRERFFGYTIASAGQNARDFIITAICYGPAGKFPNAAYRGEPTIQQSPALTDAMKKHALRRNH